MKIENRDDAILVRFLTYDDLEDRYNMITAYYTCAIEQTLKMFKYCKDYDIEGNFNELCENIPEKYLNREGYFIEDVRITFGSDSEGFVPSIEVYIK